jgi:hypothetical protein
MRSSRTPPFSASTTSNMGHLRWHLLQGYNVMRYCAPMLMG